MRACVCACVRVCVRARVCVCVYFVFVQSFELLRLSPLKELLDAKWRQFGFFYFILWFVVYLLSIIILTIVVQYRPTYCPSNITAFQSTDDLLVHELEIFSLSLDGSRVGGEVTTVANNVSSCNLHCFPLKKRRIFVSTCYL